MKRSKHKELTIAEANSFLGEYDIFEFKDVHEVTDIRFKLQKKKYVGLDMELFKKIRSRAKRLHKSKDVLIQEWLTEKVG